MELAMIGLSPIGTEMRFGSWRENFRSAQATAALGNEFSDHAIDKG